MSATGIRAPCQVLLSLKFLQGHPTPGHTHTHTPTNIKVIVRKVLCDSAALSNLLKVIQLVTVRVKTRNQDWPTPKPVLSLAALSRCI